jgi:hypothetical protein
LAEVLVDPPLIDVRKPHCVLAASSSIMSLRGGLQRIWIDSLVFRISPVVSQRSKAFAAAAAATNGTARVLTTQQPPPVPTAITVGGNQTEAARLWLTNSTFQGGQEASRALFVSHPLASIYVEGPHACPAVMTPRIMDTSP